MAMRTFFLPLLVIHLILGQSLFAQAPELDAFCPDGRVEGEFIIELKRIPTARSTSARKSSVETRLAKHAARIAHFFDATSRDIAHIQSTQQKSEAQLYKELNSDPNVTSISPNCIRKTFANGSVVSGKVVHPGFEGPDLPNITFASDSTGKIGTLSPSLSPGTINVSAPAPAEGLAELVYPRHILPLANSSYRYPRAISVNRSIIGDGVKPNVDSCSLSALSPDIHAELWGKEHVSLFDVLGEYSYGGCEFTSGDIDGDFLPDLVIVGDKLGFDGSPARVLVLFSTDQTATLQFSNDPIRVRIADMNGDGKQEIVAFTEEVNISRPNVFAIEISEYLGNGQFKTPTKRIITETPQNSSSDPSGPFALGDFNNDGAADIFIASYKSFWFLYNDGTGAFPTQNVSAYDILDLPGSVSKFTSEIEITDLNNDGLNDIVGSTSNGIYFLRNTPSGFTHYTFNDSIGEIEGFTISDLQLDGYRDIITTHTASGSILPLINRFAEINDSDTNIFPDEMFSPATEYQFALPITPIGIPLVHRIGGVQGAVVELRSNANPNTRFHGTTGPDGQFHIPLVPPGEYSLTLAHSPISNIQAHTPSIPVTVQNENVSDIVLNVRNDFLPSTIPPITAPPSGITNDPGFPLLWGLHNAGQGGGRPDVDMNIPEAWQTTHGDPGLIVAVVDTGYDYLHPDLKDGAYTFPGEIPSNAIDDDNNGYIDDVHGFDSAEEDGDPRPTTILSTHGTHVAGTINATSNNSTGIVGAAPNVKLLGVKVFWDGQAGTSDANIIGGFQYILTQRQRGLNIRVVNGSLGGKGSCPSAYSTVL
ncbi:MAG: VCBS repeat-containing protein, partial [Bdellovibrionales bacterium]|nr:VCBS repeat-containing protein [Bdellovibrionales bacterium]